MIVTAFFRFVDLTGKVEDLRRELLELQGLKGLILLAEEGLNGMAAGEAEDIARLKAFMESKSEFEGLEYKDSHCSEMPFSRWKIDLRAQIIMYKDSYKPSGKNNHLSPAEWHELLNGEEPVTVLDTRNHYETRVGLFKGAIDPQIDKFTEFSDYLETCDLPKDRKTLIYCTGGIRCEKAILDMEERGFQDVYQLDGGILKYMEEFPNEEFKGECFVFDHRVALDQNLAPSSQYWICPHCGDPGDMEIDCGYCDKKAKLCKACALKSPTCSKNCSYHWKRLNKVGS